MCRYIQSRSGVDIPQQLQSLTTAVPVTARCMCNVSVHTVTKWCRYSTTITEPNDSRTRHCTVYVQCLVHTVTKWCRYSTTITEPNDAPSLHGVCAMSVHTVTKPYPSLGVCAMCRYIQSRSGIDIPQQLQSLTTAYIQSRSGVDIPQQLQSLTTAVPVTARCMCNVSVHTVTKWCRYSTTITEPNDSRTRHCTFVSRSGTPLPVRAEILGCKGRSIGLVYLQRVITAGVGGTR
ncbi:hypothetical protein J6590_085836 [Homalodisca vitripennis]|nr:hypothetical protein J6590_085836 [Homalodisca vitripennis]